MTDNEPRLPRVRVTAPRAGDPAPAVESARRARAEEARSVYTATLIRSQLRLAVLCASGLVATLLIIGLVASFAPGLEGLAVAGVPVSWLVLAFGAYPPIVAVAAINVVAAGRNEVAYRRLVDSA